MNDDELKKEDTSQDRSQDTSQMEKEMAKKAEEGAKKEVKSKKQKTSIFANFSGQESFLTLVLGVFLFAGILLVLEKIPLRIDLTKNQVHTLSPTSKNLVSDLRDPLRISVFLSRNLPPPLNNLEVSVRDLLYEYSQSANKNFSYVIYDVTEKDSENDPKVKENIELARDYGISPQQVQTVDKDEVKLVNVYLSMVLEYGDIIERIDVLGDGSSLEYEVSSLLHQIDSRVNSLLTLEENIKATLFLPSDFVKVAKFFNIEDLSSLEGSVDEKIEESIKRSYGKLSYEKNTNDITVDFAQKENMSPYPWNAFSEQGISYEAGVGVAALQLTLKDRSVVVELLQTQTSLQLTGNGLEEIAVYSLIDFDLLAEKIDAAVDSLLEVDQKVAYLNAAGSSKILPDPQNFNFGANRSRPDAANLGSLIEKRYQLDAVGFDELDQRYSSLIIAGPTEKLTDYQLYQIDQFLMNGGSLLIFHDMFVEKPNPFPQGAGFGGAGIPEWRRNSAQLEKLVEHYGVKIKPGIVMDENSFVSRQQTVQGTTQEVTAYFAPIIQNNHINKDFLPIRNIKGFIMLAVSPLQVDLEALKQKDISAIPLFSSSPRSWVEEENISLIPMLIQKPSEESRFSSQDLGYILEGSFESFFKGKPIPKKTKEEQEQAAKELAEKYAGKRTFNTKEKPFVEESKKSASIIVLGSSQIIRNNLIDPQGVTPNSVLLLNLLDYANGQGDWAVMRAKGQQINPIDAYDGQSSFFKRFFTNPRIVKTINMVLWPTLIIILGFGFWLRQKRYRLAIEKM